MPSTAWSADALMGNVLAYLFYAVMAFALVYFLHKIAWFVRLRRLQVDLIADAVRRLNEHTSETLTTWDRAAVRNWTEARAGLADERPTDYVARVTEQLKTLHATLGRERKPVPNVMTEVTDPESSKSEAVATHVIVEIPRLNGEVQSISTELKQPVIVRPKPPDPTLYDLKLKSRYGFTRRFMVFLLGAVDVVYSSQHVAMMSQNVQVPLGVIVRRLSLVALILLVVALDVIFGARKQLVTFVEQRFGAMIHVNWEGRLGEYINENGATLIALTGWLAAYGALYLGIYLFLRQRSSRALRTLRRMKLTESERLEGIYRRQLAEVRAWGAEYSRTLDAAADVAVRQARLLAHRTLHRVRRRIATPALLRCADEVSDRLFRKLPESSQDLTDVATTHRHSIRHYLWPRREEMLYQINLAQYRAAWQHIETNESRLRSAEPDPLAAKDLWRALIAYAGMFPDIVSAHTVDELDRSYRIMVDELVHGTEADLVDLDAQLVELARGVGERVAATPGLIESRVELANQTITAEVAHYVSEIVQVRERARLEAMAFEI